MGETSPRQLEKASARPVVPAPEKEAHQDGEKGKSTARDATGEKQEGYADPEDKADDRAAE